MSKGSRCQPKQSREKTGQGGQVISFIGGLVFVSLVVGFTVANSQKLREELERQARAILRLSQEAITQGRLVVDSLRSINQLMRAEQSEVAGLLGQQGDGSQASADEAGHQRQIGPAQAEQEMQIEPDVSAYEQFWLTLGEAHD